MWPSVVGVALVSASRPAHASSPSAASGVVVPPQEAPGSRAGHEGATNESPDANSSANANASESGLAKASQNPVSSLISVPFQNNFNFGAGPGKDLQYVLNIQPVVPIGIGEHWMLVTRAIIPLIDQPVATDRRIFGLGDVNATFFLSPKAPGKVTWGVGPTGTLPTATNAALGNEKWLIGPAAVLLVTPGPWVIGVLANNQWSVAGAESRAAVSTLLIQPFVNYNLSRGWALGTSPIITADWKRHGSDRWTVPLGASVSKTTSLGHMGLQLSVQGYVNVVHPQLAPDGQLRAVVALLFPR